MGERNPSVGLAAHHGCVDIRITAKADSKANASRLLDGMQARLQERVGEHIYGIDDTTLEDVVWNQLERRQLRVHVVEAGLPGVISGSWPQASSRLSESLYESPARAYAAFAVDAATMSLREFATLVAERIRKSEQVTPALSF